MLWPDLPSLALLGAVLASSLLGSGHCAGMCGGLMLFALGAERPRSHARLHVAYHGGRGASYAAAGAVAGAVGGAADLAGHAVGLQRAAAVLAGATIGLVALFGLLRAGGVGLARMPLPPRYLALVRSAHARAAALPDTARALGVGVLTVLLPCGWLYLFVLAAAGTGGPLPGAITMLVFWLGTLPVMVALGIGLRAASARVSRHLPAWTTAALCLVGVVSALSRAASPVTLATVRASADPPSVAAPAASPHDLPCCNPGDQGS